MENLIKMYREPRYYVYDYIESSRTQYIDTNYIPPEKYFKLGLKFSITKYTDYDGLFGSGDTTFNFCGMLTSSSKLALYNGSGYYNISTNYAYDTVYDWTFLANNGTQSISDSSGVIKSGTYSGTIRALGNLPFYLFVHRSKASSLSFHYSSMRIYSAKMYSDNTTMVRDYVPVKRIENGEIGLYDKIEQKFYTNAGTGTFIIGNRIGTIL